MGIDTGAETGPEILIDAVDSFLVLALPRLTLEEGDEPFVFSILEGEPSRAIKLPTLLFRERPFPPVKNRASLLIPLIGGVVLSRSLPLVLSALGVCPGEPIFGCPT